MPADVAVRVAHTGTVSSGWAQVRHTQEARGSVVRSEVGVLDDGQSHVRDAWVLTGNDGCLGFLTSRLLLRATGVLATDLVTYHCSLVCVGGAK